MQSNVLSALFQRMQREVLQSLWRDFDLTPSRVLFSNLRNFILFFTFLYFLKKNFLL